MLKVSQKSKYNSGTTLIELLVVIAIILILTGITIFNHRKFNSYLSIQNLADDISLSIRKTQGFAIGVRKYGNLFTQGYGIHFTASPSGTVLTGSNKSFILFVDIDGGYDYDSGSDCSNLNDCIEVLSIKSNDEISEIFLDGISQDRTGTLDIMFKRPNPEPTFCYRSNPTNPSCDSTPTNVRIKISGIANPEVFKYITISNTGQISVSSN